MDVKKPIVKTERSDDFDSKDEARFGGEFRNRVKEETHAPNSGAFQAGQMQDNSPNLPEGEEGLHPKLPSLSDLMAFPRTPNRLPNDVRTGGNTLLNTDPVLYASFINRIADEIYDRWVSNARDAVQELSLSGRSPKPDTYVTKLQVVLDPDGSVTAIQTLQSSGILELDDAPKRAFWSARNFPNPPKQMFGREQLVRFVYEFHFGLRGSFEIVPWSI